MGCVPAVAPGIGVDHFSPFDGADADDEADQNEHEREVHAREHRRVPLGERGERGASRGEDPNFVSVPVRADGAERDAPFFRRFGKDLQQHGDAEVESFQREVADPQHRNDGEPEKLNGCQFHDRSFQYAKVMGADSLSFTAFLRVSMPSSA